MFKQVRLTVFQIFLVISTILWVVSGVLIHQIWGYVECANAGVPDDFGQFKSQVEGGLSLCHEIKIIEIVAWCIAGVSVLATIPVVKIYLERRRNKSHRKQGGGHSKGQAV